MNDNLNDRNLNKNSEISQKQTIPNDIILRETKINRIEIKQKIIEWEKWNQSETK